MKKKHILLAIAFSIGLGVSLSSCSDYLSVERFFNDRQSEEKIFKSKQFTEEWLAKCYGAFKWFEYRIRTYQIYTTPIIRTILFLMKAMVL